jgi:biotin synthase
MNQIERQQDARTRAPLGTVRHDWTVQEIQGLFKLPFPELVFTAQSIHRRTFDASAVQMAQLLSIKTGGCPEDCGYCSQSSHFETGLKASKLMDTEAILAEAHRAKAGGATRFCMGAAWRSPKDRDMDELCGTVSAVKGLGMETCMTLGMLSASQAQRLKEAGLDHYNHNVDTSPEHYGNIITTRTYQDRLDTLAHVREAGMSVCCGGILGIGEGEVDRASMLCQLANLPAHPESVPINMLMQVEGTPLANAKRVDAIDLVRTIAVARIVMPESVVRLSAGREHMTDEAQALCFMAGANSIFVGDKLLTTANPGRSKDESLLDRLGMRAETPDAPIRPA